MFKWLATALASALLFLSPAHAATTTLTGSASSAYTQVPVFSSGQFTSFTAYSGQTWRYAVYNIMVDAEGEYNLNSVADGVTNATFILSGPFEPNSDVPATPLYRFIKGGYGSYGSTNLTNVRHYPNRYYTVLVAFNVGSYAGMGHTLKLTGPGEAVDCGAVCTPVIPTTSTATLLILGLGLVGGALLITQRRRRWV